VTSAHTVSKSTGRIQLEANPTISLLETWSKSYTKLLAFNQTGYDRILNLDSDATILQVCRLVHNLPVRTKTDLYSDYGRVIPSPVQPRRHALSLLES